MSSAILMERSGTGIPSIGMPGMGTSHAAPTSIISPSMMMVPRCTVQIEKCTGGCRITCSADDKLACSTVQNLCAMLAGGLCSCCVMHNGLPICTCNFTMGMCRCETTDSGIVLSCTSGDTQCCEMIQACCESIHCMLEAGCTCCLLINNTPICCGAGESCETTKSSHRSRGAR